MSERITAPFTAAQVHSLNQFQFSGVFHPFTCPRDHLRVSGPVTNEEREFVLDHASVDSVRLIAFPLGWRCPHEICDYRQDWAHRTMADWSWQYFTTAGISV